MNRFLLPICFLTISSVSYADQTPPKSLPSKVTQEMSGTQPKVPAQRPLSSKKSVDKYIWMARMKKELPASLCEKNQYFVNCFDTDKKQCEKLTSVYLGACLDKSSSNLPDRLSPDQQTYWGYTMGRCTYDLYNTFMADLKKETPLCTQSETDTSESQRKASPPKETETK